MHHCPTHSHHTTSHPHSLHPVHHQSTQRGFILLPVVLAIALIATIAFLINTESAINVDMTANTTAAAEVEQVTPRRPCTRHLGRTEQRLCRGHVHVHGAVRTR